MSRKTSNATIIADSIANGLRLTTFEVVMHRFVLAEFNTHRVFSRNSASSRAIPTKKQLSAVMTNPAMPVEWGANQPGMQASTTLNQEDENLARHQWIKAMHAAVDSSTFISMDLGVHKQVSNRILEPWMWHTVIVTSVDYENFFSQRCSPLAQPEIRVVAELMEELYRGSEPKIVEAGDYHLPYLQNDEHDLDLETKKRISAARCARVSYMTHDGVRDLEKDLELYERLVTAQPPHASPLEHVATPYVSNIALIEAEDGNTRSVPILGNFTGWKQLRHEVAGESIHIGIPND